ncbi:MAG: hypothetical protein SPJ90_05870 [Prevotella sp.]|nr:hypothetical protein [Prevotellaceae bacterium]MDY5843938.1 hypothetical protein [Prevotella sp.]
MTPKSNDFEKLPQIGWMTYEWKLVKNYRFRDKTPQPDNGLDCRV